MGNRLGRRRRRRDESEDSPDEEGGFEKEKNLLSDNQNSSDEGTENVDKGGPNTWTIPVGATIALNDDSDVC